jgi:hypothetical protein
MQASEQLDQIQNLQIPNSEKQADQDKFFNTQQNQKPDDGPINQQENEYGEVLTDQGQIDPKLYVDVNIGRQGMERIVVYEGDRAEDLAREFCKKNGLNYEMEEKLKILLE